MNLSDFGAPWWQNWKGQWNLGEELVSQKHLGLHGIVKGAGIFKLRLVLIAHGGTEIQ